MQIVLLYYILSYFYTAISYENLKGYKFPHLMNCSQWNVWNCTTTGSVVVANFVLLSKGAFTNCKGRVQFAKIRQRGIIILLSFTKLKAEGILKGSRFAF